MESTVSPTRYYLYGDNRLIQSSIKYLILSPTPYPLQQHSANPFGKFNITLIFIYCVPDCRYWQKRIKNIVVHNSFISFQAWKSADLSKRNRFHIMLRILFALVPKNALLCNIYLYFYGSRGVYLSTHPKSKQNKLFEKDPRICWNL